MYQGKETLRGQGEKVSMSKKRLEEYIKCSEDIIYFAEKYFHIVSIDKGKIKIPLYEYQRRMLKAFLHPKNDKRFVIVNTPRQSGKTTVATIYLLHYILFNSDKTVAILANKEKTSREILKRIKMAYIELPLWLQQGISEDAGGWCKNTLGLENGTSVLASSTASDAIRGMSISLLYLDEFAHVPHNVADDFMSSVYPTISSGKTSKIIIVSTPLGLNHFYHLWKGAIRGTNSYMPIKIHWNEIPGRTNKWKKETIADIGPQRFLQEYGGQFLGTNSTLVDSEVLERLEIKTPIDTKLGNFLNIYEHPEKDQMYILGVDTCMGLGKNYSVVQVLKIVHERCIKQVAVYRCNTIPPHDFAQVCISISKYYNEAYMMIENNNDCGIVTTETIWNEYEYDKILNFEKRGYGIRASKNNKLAANLLLKRYLHAGWLELCDRNTVYELSRYEEYNINVFRGADGSNDDCISSLLWGLYFVNSIFFDGKKTDVKVIDSKFLVDNKEEEEPEEPIGFIDDESLGSTNDVDLDFPEMF